MAFLRTLRAASPSPDGRQWLFVAPDQLSLELGPLRTEPPGTLGVVLVETPLKAARRPYHQQKLALVLANQRHFALELCAHGVAVDYRIATRGYAEEVMDAAKVHGAPLRALVPAERELRRDLQPAVTAKALSWLRHDGWLTTQAQFRASQSASGKAGPPWRMDAFYRHARRESGLLMRDGKPEGGRFSFDTENRKPWRGQPPAPSPPTASPDAVTREVLQLVAERYGHHPGRLRPEWLYASKEDADRLWRWFLEHGLREFGPYEDAMSSRSRSLFHSRISGLLHLHRLLPRRVVEDVAASSAPLPSREGFIRQVLGWREYMHHVHVETDGFRRVGARAVATLEQPGDGGYARWAGKPWPASPEAANGGGADGGATPDHLGARTPLPPAYWGKPSGLNCLDTVVHAVWEEAYSHHITRLMVLSNLAMLLDVSPRELTDWFWVSYQDAYDWVVEPNVLAMGTFGTGALLTTKPYIAGAAYVHRMSDFCEGCRFDPKRNCPLTPLYWDFLARHRERLRDVPRLQLPLQAAAKRSEAAATEAHRIFERTRDALVAGQRLEPPE